MNFKTFLKKFDEWQSKPHMFIVNKERMKAMETAHGLLEKIVHEYTPDADIEINMSVVNDGSSSISVETDELVVHNVQDFISVIKEANNFEIYPLNNGNIRIAIMFNGVMSLIK
jgi:viroplasmin and RNaseH domain-containing protein